MTDASSQPCEGRKIQELNQMDSSCWLQTGNWFGRKYNTYFGGVFTREQVTTGTRVTVLFKLVVGVRICQSRQGQCKRWWTI